MNDEIRNILRGQLVLSLFMFAMNGVQIQGKSKPEQDELTKKFLDTQVEEFLYAFEKANLMIVPKEQIPEAFLKS